MPIFHLGTVIEHHFTFTNTQQESDVQIGGQGHKPARLYWKHICFADLLWLNISGCILLNSLSFSTGSLWSPQGDSPLRAVACAAHWPWYWEPSRHVRCGILDTNHGISGAECGILDTNHSLSDPAWSLALHLFLCSKHTEAAQPLLESTEEFKLCKKKHLITSKITKLTGMYFSVSQQKAAEKRQAKSKAVLTSCCSLLWFMPVITCLVCYFEASGTETIGQQK